MTSNFKEDLDYVLTLVETTLWEKRMKYGPMEEFQLFAKGNVSDLLRVRIDDKLRRVKNSTLDHEDTLLDLIGYLVLLYIETHATSRSRESLPKKIHKQ